MRPSESRDLSFVVCVESGIYEEMTVRMVESLRLFGGGFSDAPVIAVTPRLGPTLSRATRQRFGELGVEHVRRYRLRRSWNRFIGKVWGLGAVEHLASTETVVLVDSDVLFTGEPSDLRLRPDVDAAVCHPDSGLVGTTGPESPFEPSWRLACEAVGLTVDDLPWVAPHDGSPRMRLYVNSGVIVFRRGRGVPQRWLECVNALLDRHVTFPGWGDHFADQIALGLAIVRFGIPWQSLPYSHNYGVANALPRAWHSPELSSARVLHYHDQLHPQHWSDSLGFLRSAQPRLAAWLESKGPIRDPASRSAHAIRLGLRVPRAATRRVHRFRGWLSGQSDTAHEP